MPERVVAHLTELQGEVAKLVKTLEGERAAAAEQITKAEAAAVVADTAAAEAREAAEDARSSMRWGRVALTVAFLAIILGAIVWWQDEKEEDRREVARLVTQCENSNVSRAERARDTDERISAGFQALADVLAPGQAPEQVARNNLIVQQITERLAQVPRSAALGPQDCSKAAVLSPTSLTR